MSVKKQRHYFADKGLPSQSYGFSSSHVWMWELDHKESWVLKNWCFWTVVLEKTLESPLDCKEIKPVNPKGNQSWILIGRTESEAQAPILWWPDVKNWLIGKDPDAGKDWKQEDKWMTEDEVVGWHHRLDGHEFWASFNCWWWTGKPGVLQSMGSQRLGCDWATEPNWMMVQVSIHLMFLFTPNSYIETICRLWWYLVVGLWELIRSWVSTYILFLDFLASKTMKNNFLLLVST